MLTTIIAVIALAQLSLQASTAYDPFYAAGVVEFRPSTSLTAEARMLDNLKGYLSILESEDAKNLDVIVFPESTLNNNEEATFVPNPAKGLIIPCNVNTGEYHDLLVQLSCAARKLASYVVINLTEKELCSTVPEDTRPCASSGLNLYNTNVVFDRNGAVLSRYRKVHLYGENKNTTFAPETGWFDTDFGVRFGHFICFDILFYAPAESMVQHNGIKDFIFPSMWFSQLPFLTAVQVHQAWSYANNVNLLAAGSSNPLVGSTGTGVYNGRKGIITAKMNQGLGERKLYIAHVPKYRHLTKRSLPLSPINQKKLALPNITLKRDYLQSYESVPLNLTAGNSVKHEMCFSNSSFCCKFEIQWQPLLAEKENKFYQYRLGVYDGLRNEVAAETNQLKNCALFSCIGEDIMDCGKTMATDIDVVFENITITATYPKAEQFLIMPNSLTADMMPVPVNHFKWEETDKKNTVQMRYELNTTTPNVMAFSIYGNYYDCIVDIKPDDEDDNKGDGGDGAAGSLKNSLVVIIGIFLINLLL
ncbi:vanin-like protein 1 [Lucilia sericata]|uniref:vanin-like protein 1 n=1 Tax=Lucilia sericata TaxID=13632 RepID=UPI0018A8231C|nr:vanin-like protein 1 [Lucilia sericata]